MFVVAARVPLGDTDPAEEQIRPDLLAKGLGLRQVGMHRLLSRGRAHEDARNLVAVS